MSTTYPQDALNLIPAPPATILTTAGFTDVSVRDSLGNTAATLDKPVQIKMIIDAGTANPETGEVLAKGSGITVSTYIKSSGSWEQDTNATDAGSYQPSTTPGIATVQQDYPAGPLYVLFESKHFSYWNLGFSGLSKCTGGSALPPLVLKTPIAGESPNVELTFSAANSIPGVKLYPGIKPPADNSIIFQNVPRAGTTTLKFFYSGGQVGSNVTITNCALSTTTLTLTGLPAIIPITVQRMCSVGPANTSVLANVAIYKCGAAFLLNATAPDATCNIVTATDVTGVANVRELAGARLWIQPTGGQLAAYGVGMPSIYNWPLPTSGLYGSQAVQGMTYMLAGSGNTINYVDGLWEFCPVTGGNP